MKKRWIALVVLLLLTGCQKPSQPSNELEPSVRDPQVQEDQEGSGDPAQDENLSGDIDKTETQEGIEGEKTGVEDQGSQGTDGKRPFISSRLQDGKMVYVLTYGDKEVIYDSADHRVDGTIWVSKEDLYYVLREPDYEPGEGMAYEDLLTFVQSQLAGPITYQDKSVWLYGYLKDNQVVKEPMYTYATNFKDGYAIVSTSNDFDQPCDIINEAFEVVYQGPRKLYNYGKGFFGLVQEYFVGHGPYDAVQVLNAKGQILNDAYYFEVVPLTKDRILVGDHLSYQVLDEKGNRVDPISSRLETLTNYHKARVTEEGIWFYGEDYQGLTYASLYDLEGNFIKSSMDPTPTGITSLGDGYYVEHHMMVNERFSKIVIPQLSTGDEADTRYQFTNQVLMDTYYDERYVPLSVLDVTTEEDVTFTAERFGNIVELNLFSYWYGFGAAHPNYYGESYHVDLLTGSLYNFGDLLVEKESALAEITKLVQEMAQKEPEMYFDIADIGVTENAQFYVTEEGVEIYYSPYEIAPYAAGMPSFSFSFEQLDGLVNEESPFYKALFPMKE